MGILQLLDFPSAPAASAAEHRKQQQQTAAEAAATHANGGSGGHGADAPQSLPACVDACAAAALPEPLPHDDAKAWERVQRLASPPSPYQRTEGSVPVADLRPSTLAATVLRQLGNSSPAGPHAGGAPPPPPAIADCGQDDDSAVMNAELDAATAGAGHSVADGGGSAVQAAAGSVGAPNAPASSARGRSRDGLPLRSVGLEVGMLPPACALRDAVLYAHVMERYSGKGLFRGWEFGELMSLAEMIRWA